jgi:hypothetical protein
MRKWRGLKTFCPRIFSQIEIDQKFTTFLNISIPKSPRFFLRHFIPSIDKSSVVSQQPFLTNEKSQGWWSLALVV